MNCPTCRATDYTPTGAPATWHHGQHFDPVAGTEKPWLRLTFVRCNQCGQAYAIRDSFDGIKTSTAAGTAAEPQPQTTEAAAATSPKPNRRRPKTPAPTATARR